jgi:3-demethoxyubiquinol 3-hydroxylase
MRAQEAVHLEDMGRLVTERRARPTALLPLWDAMGFALGAGTALLGREAAHACTVAIEEAISAHYDEQVREMLESGLGDDRELLDLIKKNRDEEMEHLNTAKERGAEQAPGYEFLRGSIKAGCNLAIWITKRI